MVVGSYVGNSVGAEKGALMTRGVYIRKEYGAERYTPSQPTADTFTIECPVLLPLIMMTREEVYLSPKWDRPQYQRDDRHVWSLFHSIRGARTP